ncbi:hypothetical protein J7643_05815 [bacterium]|nr:hypothetical protein [bacterium]
MRLRRTMIALAAVTLTACQSQGGKQEQPQGGGGGQSHTTQSQHERSGVAKNQLRSEGVATPSAASPKHPSATPYAKPGKPLAPNKASNQRDQR